MRLPSFLSVGKRTDAFEHAASVLSGKVGAQCSSNRGIWSGYVGQPAARRLRTACLALFVAASGLSAAAEETNWTVLTVARNGNWGIASARTQGEAIAGAVLQMSGNDGRRERLRRRARCVQERFGDSAVVRRPSCDCNRQRPGGSRWRCLRSACRSERTLWLGFPSMPAPAADRLQWRSHNLQSETP